MSLNTSCLSLLLPSFLSRLFTNYSLFHFCETCHWVSGPLGRLDLSFVPSLPYASVKLCAMRVKPAVCVGAAGFSSCRGRVAYGHHPFSVWTCLRLSEHVGDTSLIVGNKWKSGSELVCTLISVRLPL